MPRISYRSSFKSNKSRDKIQDLPSYQYEKLQPGQIRLLKIHPGEETSELICELEVVDLRDPNVSFCALSWTWGSLDGSQASLVISGRSFRILKSLEEPLLRARSNTETHTLWVDYICINQQDTVEKAAQISMMGDVYSKASDVFVWLGPAYDDSDFLMGSLRQERRAEWATDRFSLASLLFRSRPWFRRTWVLQEFACSRRDPRLLCGDGPDVAWSTYLASCRAAHDQFAGSRYRLEDIDWEDPTFGALLEKHKTQSSSNTMSTEPDSSGVAWPFELTREEYRSCGGVRLASALAYSRHMLCSDERDRVYGLLGLLSEADRSLFQKLYPIDYAKPVARIYQDAMQFVIVHDLEGATRLWTIFAAASIRHPDSPSWVRDFSTAHQAPLQALQVAYAGGAERNQRVLIDDNCFIVSAYMIDTINDVVMIPDIQSSVESQLPQAMDAKTKAVYFLHGVFFLRRGSKTASIKQRIEVGREVMRHGARCRLFLTAITSVEDMLNKVQFPDGWASLLASLLVPGEEPDTRLTDDELDDLVASTHEVHYPGQCVSALTAAHVVKHMFKRKGLGPKVIKLLSNKSVFTTTNKFYGLSSEVARKGDLIVSIPGICSAPFVVRPQGGDRFCLVGCANLPTSAVQSLHERIGPETEAIQLRLV